MLRFIRIIMTLRGVHVNRKMHDGGAHCDVITLRVMYELYMWHSDATVHAVCC